MNVIKIRTDYITLGQMLKIGECIDSGGQAKLFLANYAITVNGESEQRRGRKLYPGDVVVVTGFGSFQID